MPKKWTVLLVVFFQLCLVLNASGQVSFSNDIHISRENVDFVIHEKYSGIDAEEFRRSLDVNGDGSVNSSELDLFRSSFQGRKMAQYLEYVLIDDGNIHLSIDSFDVSFDAVEGNVSASEMYATVSIVYRMEPSLSGGEHNIWVLGHPSIDSMRITLPERSVLLSHDGVDEPSVIVENDRFVLEGASGIRSFMVNERPTYEYAASVYFRYSPFIADLSVFNYLFSVLHPF